MNFKIWSLCFAVFFFFLDKLVQAESTKELKSNSSLLGKPDSHEWSMCGVMEKRSGDVTLCEAERSPPFSFLYSDPPCVSFSLLLDCSVRKHWQIGKRASKIFHKGFFLFFPEKGGVCNFCSIIKKPPWWGHSSQRNLNQLGKTLWMKCYEKEWSRVSGKQSADICFLLA